MSFCLVGETCSYGRVSEHSFMLHSTRNR